MAYLMHIPVFTGYLCRLRRRWACAAVFLHASSVVSSAPAQAALSGRRSTPVDKLVPNKMMAPQTSVSGVSVSPSKSAP